MKKHVSNKIKSLSNGPNKAFWKEEKLLVYFSKPQVIGALKDVLVLPYKQQLNIIKKEEEISAIKTQGEVILKQIKKIREEEGKSEEEKKQILEKYNEALIENINNVQKIKEKNTGKVMKHLKPKVLRCRIIGQTEDGFYELELVRPKRGFSPIK